MRLRAVFLVCFAAASLPAVGWSAWIAARSWSAWTDAAAAVRAAEAMGHALHLVEALSVERGALQERALSDRPVAEDLGRIAARNDALLDRAQRSMLAAGLPDEAVERAREMLAVSRAQVAEATARPPEARDPALVPSMMGRLYARLDAVEDAVAQAEAKAARASASVGALVAVGSLAVEMRSAAGRRSSLLSGWVGGRALSPRQVDEAMHLTGQVQHAWDRLRRQVLLVGEPPRLAAALAATRDGFLREAEPVYRDLVALARAGGAPPMPLPEWRRWTVAALPGTLAARDAAIAEAVEHGRALAAAARARLAVAAAATAAALALAAGSMLVLLRRLVLPMQRLAEAVSRLAEGDVAAEVPGRGRRDELGAVADAVEVFRRNAVELRLTNLRFDAALNNMSQGLAMYDGAERLVVVNRRYHELTGTAPGLVRPGMAFREVAAALVGSGAYPGGDAEEVYRTRRARVACGREARFLDELGSGLVLSSRHQELPAGGWVSVFEDVTDAHHAEARIAHMAHHDALTGLPNRALFRRRLDEALGRCGAGAAPGGFAVLCLDLDRFKAVNDTLGHPVGDALLRAVAGRLAASLREGDVAARFGGDEFAVLQAPKPGRAPEEAAAALARRLVEALGAPYDVAGHRVTVGASVGVALAPEHGACPDALLKNADLALYRAKAEGRGAWRYFEPSMEARMVGRRLLELDLRDAVAAGDFELHYQPLVEFGSRRPKGFEALLRWRHPLRGLVGPAEFIPLAEELGLIGALGEWALRRACADAASWPGAPAVAVNLSAAQLRAGPAIVGVVADALAESGLDAARLELEITEGVMLQDTEETLATLGRLKALGVSIAMDDFGTGYSSLSYLRRFPFDKVKIDRSFVRELGVEGKDCGAIIRAVADLCGGLGMAATAEGVETEEQLARLAAEGLTEGQGYLFSRPVPAAEVPRLLGAPPAAAVAAQEPALA